MPQQGTSGADAGSQQGPQGQTAGSSGMPQSGGSAGQSGAEAAGSQQAQQGQGSGQQNSGAQGMPDSEPYGGGSPGQETAQGQAPYDGADSGGFDTAQGPPGQSGDIDFSEQSGGSTSHSGMEQGGGLPSATSYEEQVAILDRQLEGSMSEYDGMILRERRNILNRGSETGSEEQVETFDRGVAYYDEGDLEGDGGDGSGEAGNQPWEEAGDGSGGGIEERQVAQAGGHPNGSNAGGPGRANDRAYAPPADIPSGDDDDVVARQIREAAMYEDDPELREKLWEEYRRYKEQTRR